MYQNCPFKISLTSFRPIKQDESHGAFDPSISDDDDIMSATDLETKHALFQRISGGLSNPMMKNTWIESTSIGARKRPSLIDPVTLKVKQVQ